MQLHSLKYFAFVLLIGYLVNCKSRKFDSESLENSKKPPTSKMEKYLSSELNTIPKDFEHFASTSCDDKKTAEKLNRFCWPEKKENIYLDFQKLGKFMTEYSSKVGTCLNRPAEGDGEKSWLQCRPYFESAVNSGLSEGPNEFCKEFVNYQIDTIYKGSQYCQYGNCAEGGLTGVCLSHRAGIAPESIFRCRSSADHNFAMIPDPKNPGEMCVLDRWDLIEKGHFFCGAQLDTAEKVLVIKEKGAWKASTAQWYQDVNCTTFASALKEGIWVYYSKNGEKIIGK